MNILEKKVWEDQENEMMMRELEIR
jgi:hypothetical protein